MKVLRNILLVLLSGALLAGCAWLDSDEKDRKSFTNVVILYQAGYYPGSNDLTIYLNKNLQAVEEGYIPSKSSENVLVLVSHKTSDPTTSPSIVRMYKKTVHKKTVMQRDTLKYYAEKDLLTEPSTMNDILAYIGEKFPSKHYGLIFSSHGTGWLPQGYYSNPRRVDPDYTSGDDVFFSSGIYRMSASSRREGGVPHLEVPPIDGIMVKSLGVESRKPAGSAQALDYEIELSHYSDCFISTTS